MNNVFKQLSQEYLKESKQLTDELAKILLTTNAALLAFWAAASAFMYSSENTYPTVDLRIIWISFVGSLFCGVLYYLMRAKRLFHAARVLEREIPEDRSAFYVGPGFVSLPWPIEKWSRRLQLALFFFGLLMTGVELSFYAPVS